MPDVGKGEAYIKGHGFADYPLGREGEPRLYARDRFVDAVRKWAPDAYRQIEDFAGRLLERLDPERLRDPEAGRRDRTLRRAVVLGKPPLAPQAYRDVQNAERTSPWSRYLHVPWVIMPNGEQVRDGRVYARPVAPRAWRRFARCWSDRWHLADPSNAWVAEWILFRVVVGERDPEPLPPPELEEHLAAVARFDAIVPSSMPGPWRWISSSTGVLVRAPVFPDWDVTMEGRREYQKHAEAILAEYISAVEREVARREDLLFIPSMADLDSDLRRLVHFQLHDKRPDDKDVAMGQAYADARKPLRRGAEAIGLKLRRVPREPRRRGRR